MPGTSFIKIESRLAVVSFFALVACAPALYATATDRDTTRTAHTNRRTGISIDFFG
jgi:hypothetical protein